MDQWLFRASLLPICFWLLAHTVSTSPTRFHTQDLSPLSPLSPLSTYIEQDNNLYNPRRHYKGLPQFPGIPVYFNNFHKMDEGYWNPSEGFTRKTKEMNDIYVRPSRGSVDRMPLTYGKRSTPMNSEPQGHGRELFALNQKEDFNKFSIDSQNQQDRLENDDWSLETENVPVSDGGSPLEFPLNQEDVDSEMWQTFNRVPEDFDVRNEKEKHGRITWEIPKSSKWDFDHYRKTKTSSSSLPARLQNRLTQFDNNAKRMFYEGNFKDLKQSDFPSVGSVKLPNQNFDAKDEEADCDIFDPQCTTSKGTFPFVVKTEPAWIPQGRVLVRRSRRSVSQEAPSDADKMAVSIVKRDLEDRKPSGIGKASLYESPHYTFSKRGHMDRMPLTFGKRGHMDRMPLTFGKRGHMDHMPLTFGKRGHMDRMPLTFGKRGHMDRMPLTFGKRGQMDRMPLTFGKRGQMDRMPLTFGKRGHMDRMPLTFGKRGHMDRMPLTFGKRGHMDRMPLTFGKRSYMDRMPLTFGKRGHMDRMPLTFGKRGHMDRMPLTFGKRGHMDRMPLTFGKRGPMERMPLTFGKRGHMDRMPLTFGKRGHMDRMPLTFGKRGPMERMPLTFGKRGHMDRMPLTFGKRGHMDRMPLTFGKRGHMDRMPLTFGKKSDMEQIALTLAKRSDPDRTQRTLSNEMETSSMNSLKPASQDKIGAIFSNFPKHTDNKNSLVRKHSEHSVSEHSTSRNTYPVEVASQNFEESSSPDIEDIPDFLQDHQSSLNTGDRDFSQDDVDSSNRFDTYLNHLINISRDVTQQIPFNTPVRPEASEADNKHDVGQTESLGDDNDGTVTSWEAEHRPTKDTSSFITSHGEVVTKVVSPRFRMK